MTEKLATEIDTYNSQIDSWKADHVGQFVLIHGTDVGGFFDSYEEALRAGYERFGLVPFLVKEVRRQQQAHFVSRLIVPQQI